MYSKSKWDTEQDGRMAEAVIRLRHGAPRKARVSRYSYEADDEIEGISKKSTGYVLEGGFTLTSHEGTETFTAGDVLVFSGGSYTLKVSESVGAIIVWAWLLPPGFG